MSTWDEWLAALPAEHAALAVEARRRMQGAAVRIGRRSPSAGARPGRRRPVVAFFACRCGR